MLATRTSVRSNLRHILSKIGYEKVLMGTEAFEDDNPNGISGCFLARCVGRKHAFARLWFLTPGHGSYVPMLASQLGISEADVHWVLKLFTERRAFMARVVYDWLGDWHGTTGQI